jgi:hypothetical protein
MAVVLLALPVLRAEDKPKDEKKPLTPKEQFDALANDYSSQQRKIITDAQKAKGEEQQKLYQKYFALGGEFAEKFYKIAEENPQDPVATDSLIWILQNVNVSPIKDKASDQVAKLIERMPFKDLATRFQMIRGVGENLLEAVLKRAEKEGDDKEVPALLSWIVMNGSSYPVGQKAAEVLLDKYPASTSATSLFQMMGAGYLRHAGDILKKIQEKDYPPRIKGLATLAEGQLKSHEIDELGDNPKQADKVALEAESCFTKALNDYAKDVPDIKSAAERGLNYLNHYRVGKTPIDVVAKDLDEKEFKLSDYRGKVVLLDFWGNW